MRLCRKIFRHLVEFSYDPDRTYSSRDSEDEAFEIDEILRIVSGVGPQSAGGKQAQLDDVMKRLERLRVESRDQMLVARLNFLLNDPDRV